MGLGCLTTNARKELRTPNVCEQGPWQEKPVLQYPLRTNEGSKLLQALESMKEGVAMELLQEEQSWPRSTPLLELGGTASDQSRCNRPCAPR